MKSRTALLAIIVATVTACSGSDNDPGATSQPPPDEEPGLPPTEGIDKPAPPPPGTPESEKFFEERVYPSLRETCGACHIEGRSGAPRWLGADAKSAYQLLKVDYYNGKLAGPPSANLLILKDYHAGGQKLTGQQRGLVEQWLQLEYVDDDGLASKTFSQALQNFANCMNFNAWQAAGLDQIANTDASGATCDRCHNDGNKTGRLILNANDAQLTFDNFRIFPSITKLVTSNSFPFKQLVRSDRIIDKGLADRNCVVNQALLDLVDANSIDATVLNDPNYCHPNYVLAEAVEDSLEFFVDNNIAISESGNCANQGQP